jgi:colanic acid/amylovoran biosynthesis glycosyltransferase
VTEQEPAALADAILQLLKDNELWRRYSLAGRKRVVTDFNLARQTCRLEVLFEQLLTAAGSSVKGEESRLYSDSLV